MNRTILSIARLDIWVPSVVHCLRKRKKGGRHRQKNYSDAYKGKVDTAIKKLLENETKFVKY